MAIAFLATAAFIASFLYVGRAWQYQRSDKIELRSLRAALDQTHVGLVLLDSELRAQFINREYRTMFHLSDTFADSRPVYSDLLRHKVKSGVYDIGPSMEDEYVKCRILRIRRGEEAPLDIRLANGDVIRCRCKVLADGGRLLNYGNVSDLVHMADQLAAMAIVDELTGAFNRRHFLWELETEWNRSRNHGRSLALLMLDIDAFKSINDRFGHDAGDQVLAQVAVLCRTLKREADTVARIGGEEFAILLPETDLEEARSVAERLRHALAAQVLVAGAGTIAISVSIGVAVAHEEMRNQSDLMKCADEALYAAKRTGRNRVVAASERDVATVLTSRPANTA